jgi:hypothetical protein
LSLLEKQHVLFFTGIVIGTIDTKDTLNNETEMLAYIMVLIVALQLSRLERPTMRHVPVLLEA